MPPPQPRVQGASPRDAHEESDQHRGEGVGRTADDEGQGTRPRDLVDHRDRAGHPEGSHGEPRQGQRVGGRSRLEAVSADRRVCPARPPIDHGQDTHREVGRSRDRHREAVAQRRQQNVARQQDTQDGSERVDGVERADGPPHAGLAADEGLAQDRQGSAHQGRRDHEDREDDHELDNAQRLVGGVEGALEPHVRARRKAQKCRHQCAVDADPDLEESVGADRVLNVGCPPGKQEATQRQPAHERRQHGRDRVNGMAEDQAEHPEPEDLVDEPRRPRQEEAQQNDGVTVRARALGWRQRQLGSGMHTLDQGLKPTHHLTSQNPCSGRTLPPRHAPVADTRSRGRPGRGPGGMGPSPAFLVSCEVCRQLQQRPVSCTLGGPSTM